MHRLESLGVQAILEHVIQLLLAVPTRKCDQAVVVDDNAVPRPHEELEAWEV